MTPIPTQGGDAPRWFPSAPFPVRTDGPDDGSPPPSLGELTTPHLRPSVPSAEALISEFLAGMSRATRRAYAGDLQRFARYLGSSTPAEAMGRLLGGGPGQGNRVVLGFKASLLEVGLSPATINRALASVRTLVAFANTLEVVTWHLPVRDVRRQAFRDTAGPGIDGIQRLLFQARAQSNPAKAARDHALLWLLVTPALRAGEVVSLTMADVDLDQGTSRLQVQGKGRREKSWVTLPAETAAALRGWIDIRGAQPGPLFTSLSANAEPGHHLTTRSVHRTLVALGRGCGMRVWPHALRHSGITIALGVAPLRDVQRFGRHADPRTTLAYDDAREDLAGDVAQQVATRLHAPATTTHHRPGSVSATFPTKHLP